MIVIIVSSFVVSNFLKLLATAAIHTSQMTSPKMMALLKYNSSVCSYMVAVFANTDPYIPNQNKIVSGLEMDMKNPVMKDLDKEASLFPLLSTIFPAPSNPSTPV